MRTAASESCSEAVAHRFLWNTLILHISKISYSVIQIYLKLHHGGSNAYLGPWTFDHMVWEGPMEDRESLFQFILILTSTLITAMLQIK